MNINIKQKFLDSRWLINLIGLKALYQIIYIVFNLIVVKKLSVAEYGVYSYVVALIVYFSSIPLLGFPIYLQKNVSRKNVLDGRYFLLTMSLCLIAFGLVFFFMPSMTILQKLFIANIVLVNCAIAIPVAINDGIGKYSFQYKLLFFNSGWMLVCIIQTLLLQKDITFSQLLSYWWMNSIVALVIVLSIAYFLLKKKLHLSFQIKRSYHLILIDLIFLYSISIPDGFARFYDRYLAHHYLSDDFLGSYSFNLMVVTTVYALFIRPINSVLFTQLAQASGNMAEYMKIIKRYYSFGLLIYTTCFLVYVPFSKFLLIFLGLEKYIGTLNLFSVCFTNAVFYFLSLPFVSLITLSENNKKKLCYCCASLLIFNTPFMLLLWEKTSYMFLLGFILAYFMNLLLCVSMEWQLALTSLDCIKQECLLFFRRKSGNTAVDL